MSQEKMDKIIETEKQVYKNLVYCRFSLLRQYQVILNYYYDGDTSILKNDSQYNQFYADWVKSSDKYNAELQAYYDRQKEYRTAPKSSYKEMTDTIYKALQSAYNKFAEYFGVDGVKGQNIGFAALLIPLAKWVGPIILTWIGTIFYDKVMNSGSQTKDLADKLAETDPQAAVELSKIASQEEVQIKKAESENSLMGQIGKGLKVASVLGIIFLGAKYVIIPEVDKRRK